MHCWILTSGSLWYILLRNGKCRKPLRELLHPRFSWRRSHLRQPGSHGSIWSSSSFPHNRPYHLRLLSAHYRYRVSREPRHQPDRQSSRGYLGHLCLRIQWSHLSIFLALWRRTSLSTSEILHFWLGGSNWIFGCLGHDLYSPVFHQSQCLELGVRALTHFFRPLLTIIYSPKYGYIWFPSSLLAAAFIYFCLPELKDRTLEEIDEMVCFTPVKDLSTANCV